MPPSASLTSFFEGIDAARQLLAQEANYPDPPDAASKPLVVGLRGGAAVLMVAAFEEFLRSAFQERLGGLVGVPPIVDFQKLPDRMRVRSVFASLEMAMGTRRSGGPGKRVDRLHVIRRTAGTIVAELLDPVALSDIGTNPDSVAVAALFKGLDIDDVFGMVRPTFDVLWGKPEANTFVVDKLDETVFRRHVVAHTADALKIPRADLPGAVDFLSCLATVLDDALESHVDALRLAAPP